MFIPTSAACKRKNCVQTPNCAKKSPTAKITIYFQHFSRGDSRHNKTPYLHAFNRRWDYWEGPYLDILSKGPRVPSYATGCNWKSAAPTCNRPGEATFHLLHRCYRLLVCGDFVVWLSLRFGRIHRGT